MSGKHAMMFPYLNRLYAIDASKCTRVYALNRDRRLEVLVPLLQCYSRVHHFIVDQFGLGILCVVSAGNTFSVALRSPVDFQKGSTNEVTDRDRDGYNRLDR